MTEIEILKKFPPGFYLVGGAVRDVVLGYKPKDYDLIAVGYTPQQLIEMGGIAVDPKTAIPVFLFSVEGQKVEVALPRKEIKNEVGYKGFKFVTGPEISLEEDLRRRDFTINTLAMDHQGKIYDFFGGLEDLRNKIIKAVNPLAFTEDPLRVLRAARFAAKGFNVDSSTLNLMNKISLEELKTLPVERFTGELLKALKEKNFGMFLTVLGKVPNACQVFFPELLKSKEIPAGPAEYHSEKILFNHIINVVEQCKTVEGRFAALFHDLGKILIPKELWPKFPGHDLEGIKIVEKIKQRWKGIKSGLFKVALYVVEMHMKMHFNLRPSTMIKMAERAIKNGAEKALIEVAIADGAPINNINSFKKAINVASLPVRELGVTLTGKAPKDIYNIILAARVARMKQGG